MKPPTAKPTTAAPIASSRLCSRTWRRQSVSSVTRPRSCLDRVRELLALALDVGADLGRAASRSAGGLPRDRLAGAAVELGVPAAHGVGPFTGGSSVAVATVAVAAVVVRRRLLGGRGRPGLERLLDPLALLDREVGGRRRALLEGLLGEHPGDRGDDEEHHRLDQEAGPEVIAEEGVVERPGDRQHEQDQAEEGERPGGDPDDAAADEGVDLLGDLGLRELDLLAHEGRDALGDVEDELADRAVLVWPTRGLVARITHFRDSPKSVPLSSSHSGGSSPKTRCQIRAETRIATTLASAPVPATSPVHISRLTISLSTALPTSAVYPRPGQ